MTDETMNAELSAPQEAGKGAMTEDEFMTARGCPPRKFVRYGDCQCILTQYCDGTCNPIYEDPEPSKEAGKVEAVADEPFGWFYEMDRKANPKAGPVYLGGDDQKIVQTVADDEGAKAFPLYLRPSQQALSDEQISEWALRMFEMDVIDIEIELRRILAAAGGSEK